jgi:hypothetical protein
MVKNGNTDLMEVVDPKRIIGKNGGAEEEERHKGSLTKKTHRPDGAHLGQFEDRLVSVLHRLVQQLSELLVVENLERAT